MAFARNEAIPPGVDGFTYVAEPGRMAGNTQDEIKKTLGAASTEAVIKIRFIAPIEKIWVKSEKAKPFKLAVEEGIDTYLISDMDVVDLREKPQDQEAIARLGAATSGFMID